MDVTGALYPYYICDWSGLNPTTRVELSYRVGWTPWGPRMTAPYDDPKAASFTYFYLPKITE